MALNSKQKKYIRKNLNEKSVTGLASDLRVDRQSVKSYVERLKRKGVKKNKAGTEWVWWKDAEKMSILSWIGDQKWALMILALLVLGLYGWTLNYAFVSDDVFGIVNTDLSKWELVWQNPLAFLRPLYYFLAHAVMGKVPWAYRGLNLLIHVGVVWVVYWLVERIYSRSAGVVAAVLVAIHPMMIESVTWISGGGHSQYSLFSLLSFGCFWWFMALEVKDEVKRRGWWLYILSLTFFGLALLSSEKAVVLPALLVLVLVIMKRVRVGWKWLIPFGLLAGVWVVYYGWLLPQRMASLSVEFSELGTTSSRWFRAPVALSSYIWLTLWPQKLTLYHTGFVMSWKIFGVRVLGVMLYGFLLAGWWWKGRGDKTWWYVASFMSWMPIVISPTLIVTGAAWLVAERYAYLGVIGLLIGVAVGLDYLMRKTKMSEMILVMIILIGLGLSLRTVVRNRDWMNQDSLWLSQAEVSANSPQNNNNLGDLFVRRGDLNRAKFHFEKAVQLKPGYADAYHNLANVMAKMGDYEKAIVYFEEALNYKPQLWQSHMQLARVYITMDDVEKARLELMKVLQIQPNNQQALQALEMIK